LIILFILYIIRMDMSNPKEIYFMRRLTAMVLCVILCMAVVGCKEDNMPTGSNTSNISQDSSSNPDDLTSSQNGSSDEESSQSSSQNTSSTESAPQKPYLDPNFDPYDEEARYNIDFDSWEMYLANPWNPVPDSVLNLTGDSPELAKVNMKYRPNPAVNSQLYFDARAIDCLHAMIIDAEKAGVNLDVISAYRTNTFQTNNFNNKVARVKAANPSLTQEEAENEAATAVARPGTSEHQLGLAVDFNSVEDSFRNTRAYAWLVDNCTDYGFILRYEPDKKDKTGIIPEPWHYRYVGVENAKMIEASGLCMEEFIEKYKS
jgi:D-alanyl-D-alanine carboxypeptidase